MIRYAFILFLISSSLYLSAQIDTLTIKKEIDDLTTLEEHRQYLQEIIDIDQKYRGSQTVESLDKLNLIKAICYFNKHGYPSGKTLGKYNGGVTLPYIHNTLPGVKLLSFSIIMEGFRIGEIDELTFREGYLRSLYHRKYGYKPFERDGPSNPNNVVRNGSLQSLLQDLSLSIKKPISLKRVLETYEREEALLNDVQFLVGTWGENKQGSDVRIFIDSNGDYYYHKLYNDRSHYPQKLQLEGPLKFELYDYYILELTSSKNYLKVYIDGKFSKALKSVL